jgi:anti-sigma factor RsiW
MQNDRYDRLSEYLDGELSDAERAELDERLARDDELRAVLEELRAVAARARTLVDRPPTADLWPGVEARVHEMRDGAGDRRPATRDDRVVELGVAREARRRRLSFTVPQLVAASVAMVLLGSAAVWLSVEFTGGDRDGGPVATAPRTGPEASFAAAEEAAPSYEAAIRDLETRLETGRERLDTATVRILEHSLATIDRAIERAQAALEADPANAYLNRHLADAKTRKLQLLRQANALSVVET